MQLIVKKKRFWENFQKSRRTTLNQVRDKQLMIHWNYHPVSVTRLNQKVLSAFWGNILKKDWMNPIQSLRAKSLSDSCFWRKNLDGFL